MRDAAAFLHATEPALAAFFIEEFLEEARRSGAFEPLYVSGWGDPGHALNPLLSERRDLPSRHLRCLGFSGAHACEYAATRRALEDVAKKRREGGGVEYVAVLPVSEISAPVALEYVDRLFYLCAEGADAVARLYRALARTGGEDAERVIKVAVVFSGIEDVDDAAERFVSFRNECKRLYKGAVELDFMGNFSLDHEKVKICREVRAKYRDLFDGDGFYGRLKSAAKRFANGLEKRLAQ
jgi:hypothetical protein